MKKTIFATLVTVGLLCCYTRSECKQPKAPRVEFLIEVESDEATLERYRTQIIQVYKNRLSQFGLDEFTVKRKGRANIAVSVTTSFEKTLSLSRLKNLLLRSGRIEFKLVDDQSSYLKSLQNQPLHPGVRMKSNSLDSLTDTFLVASGKGDEGRKLILAFLNSTQQKLPKNREIVFAGHVDGLTTVYRTYLLHKKASLTTDSVTDATVQKDMQIGNPKVSITLDKTSAAEFEKLTTEHVRERLAIVLDGQVLVAPLISGPITDGRIIVTLGATKNSKEALLEAQDLSVLIRSGSLALAAPVQLIRETTVDP